MSDQTVMGQLTHRGSARVTVDGAFYEVRVRMDADDEPGVSLDVLALLLATDDIVRDAKALGWDRAHTMLCTTVPCRAHRNPWIRSRA